MKLSSFAKLFYLTEAELASARKQPPFTSPHLNKYAEKIGKPIEYVFEKIMGFVIWVVAIGLVIALLGAIVYGAVLAFRAINSAFPESSGNFSKALPWVIGVVVAQVAWGRLQRQMKAVENRLEKIERAS